MWIEYIYKIYEDNSRNTNMDDNEYSDLKDKTPIIMVELRISLEELEKRTNSGPDEIIAIFG